MALFTQRDRIAIAVIALLILAGWSIRLWMANQVSSGGLRVIREAVETPAAFSNPDTLAVSGDKNVREIAVDINTALAEELETLPSIGPSRAAAIISYREEHGVFMKPDDIMKVPGVGPGIFRRIETRITVSEKANSD